MTHYSDSKAPTRELINVHIRAHPGVHFNELVRELDLANGQVQYHLRRLIRRDRVVDRSLYGRTHYYEPDFDRWEQSVLAMARRETPREILFCVLEDRRRYPDEVAEELDIARSTLEWHLSRLDEQRIIEKQHLPKGNVKLVATEPERTIQLLARVTPTATDKLADRFLRFIDHTFEPYE